MPRPNKRPVLDEDDFSYARKSDPRENLLLRDGAACVRSPISGRSSSPLPEKYNNSAVRIGMFRYKATKTFQKMSTSKQVNPPQRLTVFEAGDIVNIILPRTIDPKLFSGKLWMLVYSDPGNTTFRRCEFSDIRDSLDLSSQTYEEEEFPILDALSVSLDDTRSLRSNKEVKCVQVGICTKGAKLSVDVSLFPIVSTSSDESDSDDNNTRRNTRGKEKKVPLKKGKTQKVTTTSSDENSSDDGDKEKQVSTGRMMLRNSKAVGQEKKEPHNEAGNEKLASPRRKRAGSKYQGAPAQKVQAEGKEVPQNASSPSPDNDSSAPKPVNNTKKGRTMKNGVKKPVQQQQQQQVQVIQQVQRGQENGVHEKDQRNGSKDALNAGKPFIIPRAIPLRSGLVTASSIGIESLNNRNYPSLDSSQAPPALPPLSSVSVPTQQQQQQQPQPPPPPPNTLSSGNGGDNTNNSNNNSNNVNNNGNNNSVQPIFVLFPQQPNVQALMFLLQLLMVQNDSQKQQNQQYRANYIQSWLQQAQVQYQYLQQQQRLIMNALAQHQQRLQQTRPRFKSQSSQQIHPQQQNLQPPLQQQQQQQPFASLVLPPPLNASQMQNIRLVDSINSTPSLLNMLNAAQTSLSGQPVNISGVPQILSGIVSSSSQSQLAPPPPPPPPAITTPVVLSKLPQIPQTSPSTSDPTLVLSSLVNKK